MKSVWGNITLAPPREKSIYKQLPPKNKIECAVGREMAKCSVRPKQSGGLCEMKEGQASNSISATIGRLSVKWDNNGSSNVVCVKDTVTCTKLSIHCLWY